MQDACTGNLIQGLAEAAEALRHSGTALHSSEASTDQGPGEQALSISLAQTPLPSAGSLLLHMHWRTCMSASP